jgi:hypothetical protein
MEGLLFTIGALVVIAIVIGLIPRRKGDAQGPEQTTDPPGERTPPDDWPRDGGDNPRAP